MIRQTAQLQHAVLFLCGVLTVNNAVAQITSDGSLGTTVNQSGMVIDITGGTQVSNNLFHSFGIFDVNTGETASFQGPAGITNILSRVTGGSVSNIDGTLQSTINGANLYLINPAGVVFGANASLDVQGSFHVTTADYISLGSDGSFHATVPADSVLSMSEPSAFGFVSASSAPIELNGSFLRTQDFATLSVIGGDITISDATLHAMEGRINLASVASAGEVVPSLNGLDTSSFASLGDINITHSTNIAGRPKGDNFGLPLGNIDVSGDGAGDIYIRSGNFYSDNGQVYSDTQNNGAAGVIDMEIRGELKEVNEGRITADVFFGGSGGDINVAAGRVVLESGSVIRTLTTGSADAGNVVIDASESVSISGLSSDLDPRLGGNERASIASETSWTGDGGQVEINTPVLLLSDQATVSTESIDAGRGGDLLINAGSVTITERASVTQSVFREGNGGSMIINANEFSLSSGGIIDSISAGSGDAGSIVINVVGLAEITGVDNSDPMNPEPSRITSNAFAEGNGGTIEINAGHLVMADGGLVQANVQNLPFFGQPSVATDTRAGSININAANMDISGGAQVISGNDSIGIGGTVSVDVADTLQISGSSSDGSQNSGLFNITGNDGAAGHLQVSAGELIMNNGANINTSTFAAGNAGQISIDVAKLNMNNGAFVSSSTSASGKGGEVRVNASEHIIVSGSSASGFASGFYSDVEIAEGASAADASGNGGSIQLSAPVISLLDGATVSAKSTGTGNAGDINIDAFSTVNLIDGASVTTASSISGGGRINLNAQDTLLLRDSSITSSVADGSGNGGDITIDPVFVILDSSQIIARADAGNGGNISITTDYLLASPDSVIDASSNTGIDGEVVIESPNDNLVAALAELPDSLLNANALLKQRCAARTAGSGSSLVVTGPGGLPPQPGGLIYSSVPSRQVDVAKEGYKEGGRHALLLGCSKDSTGFFDVENM